MKLRLFIVVLSSKLIIHACRAFRLGGTSFPGKIAGKLYPGILKELASGHRLIFVSGTNGKTTTTSMIGKILEQNKIEYISNKSGANLAYGIICMFIESYRFFRKNNAAALIEIDEAAFPKVVQSMEPECIVVTNFFRDQLDRYGEMHTTINNMEKGMKNIKKAKLILNADDSLCSALGRNLPLEKIYYGFDKKLNFIENEFYFDSDAAYCIYCKAKYDYSNRIYGHLGGYSCPVCHYSRPQTDVSCTGVIDSTGKDSIITLSVGLCPDHNENKSARVKINLPGLYNIYNSIAAITCGCALGLPLENSFKALESFTNTFGRMESIRISDKDIHIILVKNPTGFNQVLDYISSNKNTNQLALLINDNPADGKDISWLWDVEFEKISPLQDRFQRVFVSGTRAEDMALRLKYAGFDSQRIQIVKDYETLLHYAVSDPQVKSFCILPTYTALLDIRKLLRKKVKLKEIWK